MIRFKFDAIPKRPGIYIVGGTLRDRLLGVDSHDVDIAVQGNPQELAEQIAERVHRRVIPLGRRAHPLFRVITPDHIFDITALAGGNIETDLHHRDFTINALAYETWSHKLIDVTLGIRDIHDRLIRQVSPDSFQADPLRLLRAYRLASQLEFQIEADTSRSLHQTSALIHQSSVERIQVELSAIFTKSRVHYWLRSMADSTILFQIFPELKALVGCRQGSPHAFDVFEHTMQTLLALDKVAGDIENAAPEIAALMDPISIPKRVRLHYAALLHDIGKPITRQESSLGQIRFHGHEKVGAHLTAAIGLRLRLPRKETESIVQLVQHHLRPLHLFKAFKLNQLRSKGMTRFFMNTKGFSGDLLILSLADMLAKNPEHRESLQSFREFLAKLADFYTTSFKTRSEMPALINGFDLIHTLHLTPSPLFSTILQHVREAQLSGRVSNPKEALALAAEMASQISPTSDTS
jgi:putative nucleotidyltransferase with HDIG domain